MLRKILLCVIVSSTLSSGCSTDQPTQRIVIRDSTTTTGVATSSTTSTSTTTATAQASSSGTERRWASPPRASRRKSFKLDFVDPLPTEAPAGPDIQDRLADCESGDHDGKPPITYDTTAHSDTGKYHGAFQFSLDTWRSLGGTGDPHTHTYEQQKAIVKKIPISAYKTQFPTCARILGVA